MLFSSFLKNKETFCSAIVLGAGNGTRMQSSVRKQFIEIAGKPIIVHTLEAFEGCDAVDEVILVISGEDIVFAQDLVKTFGLYKVTKIVAGGKRRQDSVLCGLKEISPQAELVAVHDGARPMIQPSDITKVIQEADASGAASLGVKVKDTIKATDDMGKVISTLDRSCLYHIQTPQVFRKNILMEGHENAVNKNLEFTDDSSMVEAIGISVQIVEGRYDNIKVTTPEDLIYMNALLEMSEK